MSSKLWIERRADMLCDPILFATWLLREERPRGYFYDYLDRYAEYLRIKLRIRMGGEKFHITAGVQEVTVDMPRWMNVMVDVTGGDIREADPTDWIAYVLRNCVWRYDE